MPLNNQITEETYILTGATGFLGSHLMAKLLLQGKGVVIAGRSSEKETLEQRIGKLLNWFGISHLSEKIEYYETDFLKTGIGLEEKEYSELCSRNLNIIHCASDTSFSEKNRERVMASNVENLSEVLNFAENSRAHCFHYISTAYASGTDRLECPEKPVCSERFTNVYEESKACAEHAVAERCGKKSIPFTIIRPSIVYGDSLTGRSLRFNALYYPVKSLLYIRDIYLNDINNNKGIKAAGYGIYINSDGKLHLPIRIFIPEEGRINLIPVNYFTDTIFEIIMKPVSGTFYHITDNNPVSMEILTSYTERFLNITGIEVVTGNGKNTELNNPPEELFDHFIAAYRPYLSDRRNFIRKNTDIATSGAQPPDLSYEIFERCMAYAVSVNWGKKLF